MVVLKTDYTLSFADSFHVNLSDTLLVGNNRTIIDYNGYYITSGFFLSTNFGPPATPFVFKIDDAGNIMQFKVGAYDAFGFGFNLNVIEDFDKQGYYLFDQRVSGDSKILHIDSNLNLKSSGSLQMPNNTQNTVDAGKIGSDKLFYLSWGITHGQRYAVCLDTSNNVRFYKELGNPKLLNRIMNGLSIAGNNLFIASTYIPDLYNLYYPDDTNSIKVIKMDTSFNIQWDVNIGWEAYFSEPAVQATRDGGCLVSALVWDADTMNYGAYVVLFKLDANGNVTGTQRIEDVAGHTLNPYPNPGNDYFYLDIPVAGFNLQVIDQHGKVLTEQPLTKERSKINMTLYSSGIYFLRLTNNQNRIVGSGKWIKQ